MSHAYYSYTYPSLNFENKSNLRGVIKHKEKTIQR